MEQIYPSNFVHICGKQVSNTAKCGAVATQMCLVKGSAKEPKITYRCVGHMNASTANTTVISATKLDQSENIKIVKDKLESLVGTFVRSKHHGLQKEFLSIYVKNVGLMCRNRQGGWEFIYYHQLRV